MEIPKTLSVSFYFTVVSFISNDNAEPSLETQVVHFTHRHTTRHTQHSTHHRYVHAHPLLTHSQSVYHTAILS